MPILDENGNLVSSYGGTLDPKYGPNWLALTKEADVNPATFQDFAAPEFVRDASWGIETEAERRAREKYGLGGGGWPEGIDWYLGQQGLSGMADPRLVQQDRQDQLEYMRKMEAKARGEGLRSTKLGEQYTGAMQAQAASAGRSGVYNPAVAQQASWQQGFAPQQIIGHQRQAELSERNAYMAALEDARARMLQQEQDRWRDLGVEGLARGEQRADWIDMGLQDKYAQLGYQGSIQKYREEQSKANRNQWWDIAKTGAGAALKFGTSSDINAKKNVRSAGEDIDEFLSALQPSTYQYKDPSATGAAPGQHTGVMAQDLERSSVGRSLVTDTPQGKMVDYRKATPAMLASLVHVNDRQRALEAKVSAIVDAALGRRAPVADEPGMVDVLTPPRPRPRLRPISRITAPVMEFSAPAPRSTDPVMEFDPAIVTGRPRGGREVVKLRKPNALGTNVEPSRDLYRTPEEYEGALQQEMMIDMVRGGTGGGTMVYAPRRGGQVTTTYPPGTFPTYESLPEWPPAGVPRPGWRGDPSAFARRSP